MNNKTLALSELHVTLNRRWRKRNKYKVGNE